MQSHLPKEISPMQVSIHEYHQRLAQWGPAWEQLESLQRSHEEMRRLLEESQVGFSVASLVFSSCAAVFLCIAFFVLSAEGICVEGVP